MKEKRIKSLDGFRVVAILVIVLSHMNFLGAYSYGNIWARCFNNATLGTDFFFVLSGFGIYLRGQKEEQPDLKHGMRFAVKKIQKIYHFYFIMLVVSVPYSIIMDMEDATFTKACIKAVIKFAGCMTLCQSAFGTSYTSHALIATSWFLSTIFLCYIVCPRIKKLLSVMNNSNNFFLIGVVLVITEIISVCFRNIEYYAQNKGIVYINDLFYGSPYIRIWYLVIGMIIGMIYEKGFLKNANKLIEISIQGGNSFGIL